MRFCYWVMLSLCTLYNQPLSARFYRQIKISCAKSVFRREQFMCKLRFLIIIFILASSYTAPSFALGKLGHQLVCQLSYDLLSNDKKRAIEQLLQGLSDTDIEAINRYNRQTLDADITYASACTWADAIKRESVYERYKSWHYLNVPRNSELISANSCEKDCLTQAIIFHSRQLKQAKIAAKRREALLFIGHWLGDIHQPLHISYASDLGGNRSKVKPLYGKCDNLHWYWDQCLLYREKPPEHQSLFESLYQQLSPNMHGDKSAKWHEDDVFVWANESITLIRQEKFGYCQLNGKYCQIANNKPMVITEDYHNHYQQVLLKRIQLAAQRLATLLNDAL